MRKRKTWEVRESERGGYASGSWVATCEVDEPKVTVTSQCQISAAAASSWPTPGEGPAVAGAAIRARFAEQPSGTMWESLLAGQTIPSAVPSTSYTLKQGYISQSSAVPVLGAEPTTASPNSRQLSIAHDTLANPRKCLASSKLLAPDSRL
jgi:hypothetical protein